MAFNFRRAGRAIDDLASGVLGHAKHQIGSDSLSPFGAFDVDFRVLPIGADLANSTPGYSHFGRDRAVFGQ